MISNKQLEANKSNAKLGGVKTKSGKEISRLNAIKHNVLGNILSDEEAKDALVIQTKFTQEYQPQSTTEEVLIERMTIWYVRLMRATKAESEKIRQINDPTEVKTTDMFPDLDFAPRTEVIHQGYDPKITSDHIETFEKVYLKYESQLERNFYKALHELQRVQAARRGDAVPTSLALDINLDEEK